MHVMRHGSPRPIHEGEIDLVVSNGGTVGSVLDGYRPVLSPRSARSTIGIAHEVAVSIRDLVQGPDPDSGSAFCVDLGIGGVAVFVGTAILGLHGEPAGTAGG